MTYAELKAEIENDPAGLGLAPGGVWQGDQQIADLLNAKGFVADRTEVPTPDLIGAISYDAYNGIGIDEQEYLQWITQSEVTQITDAVKLRLTGRTPTNEGVPGTGNDQSSWWSAQTRAATVAAILPMIEVPASRAEVLWGLGTIISAGDVGRAANA